ncbi:MAG: phage portal protein, partial [Xanthomonadales bacterium]|nr:phage portal protein [Xanthomonadales bacterium]
GTDFAGNIYKNGGKLSGVLKVAQMLNPEQRKEVLKAWNDSYSGSGNAGKTGLLHNGAEFQTVSMNLVDA